LFERSDYRASTASFVAQMIAVFVTGGYCCLDFVGSGKRPPLLSLYQEEALRGDWRDHGITASTDDRGLSPATEPSYEESIYEW
jgi:hypothetical protein